MTTAHAGPAQAEQCTGAAVEIPFDALGGAVELSIRQDGGIAVHLPGKQVAAVFESRHPNIDVKRIGSYLEINAKPGAKPGDSVGLKIAGRNNRHLSLRATVVDKSSPAPAPETVRLVPRSELEARAALVSSRVEARVQKEFAKRDREDAARAAREAEEAPYLLAEQLLGTNQLRVNALKQLPVAGDSHVSIREIVSHREADREVRHVRFSYENPTNEVQVFDDLRFGTKGDDTVAAEVVLFSQPSAGYVRFPLRVQPGEKVTGIARLPDGINIPNQGLAIALDGPKLLQPLVAEATHLASLITFEEELRRIRKREREEKKRRLLREAREARGQQTILTALARGGAHFVRDGVDGSEQLSAASTWAVGGRVTKGLTEALAFEAEVVGGRTGNGQFDDVEWDGMTGEIERSASFGRVGIGMLLRLGDITIPYAHAGAGVQFAGYTSTFTSGAVSTDGPGDGFELAGFVTAGGGIDYRPGGGNLIIGARASFTAIQGGERVIDAGVQLGVGL
ncbi:MAG: hypothetical protein Tsb0020_07960 [Haliangiales bacterium]